MLSRSPSCLLSFSWPSKSLCLPSILIFFENAPSTIALICLTYRRSFFSCSLSVSLVAGRLVYALFSSKKSLSHSKEQPFPLFKHVNRLSQPTPKDKEKERKMKLTIPSSLFLFLAVAIAIPVDSYLQRRGSSFSPNTLKPSQIPAFL